MKLIRHLAILAVLALTPVSFSFATTSSPTPTTSPAPATTKVKDSNVTQVIASIDPTAKTMVLTAKKPITYTFTDASTITLLDQTAGTIADLKVGDRVTVHYTKVDATNRTVRTVLVKPAKTTMKASVTPAPGKTATPAAPAQ
jgi:ribosomal protein S1